MFRFFGYRSFEPEYDTMKTMRSLGIDTFAFMVSNNCNFMGEPYTRYQPTWIWEREYDFTLFDRNMDDLVNAVPDAGLICVFDINPPQWWLRRGDNNRRFDPFCEFGRVAASEEYRNDVVDYMWALLKHAVEKYPGRLKAVAMMGGRTTEWFDYSRGIESIPRIEAWNRYRAERHLPEAPIPDMASRYSGMPESNGLLRSPEKHRTALEYWKFNSELSFDTLSFFLRNAREVLPPEIGLTLCYGYIFELRPNCQASWSQLEYERIFDMKEVDFALEPISYGEEERGMGGSPLSMIPMQTLKVRGKNILNSIDTTTFTSRFPKAPGRSGGVSIAGRGVEWKTPAEVEAGIKREMCFNLINGCSTWYFDMWGGWYDNEAARKALSECRKIWGEESILSPADAFEILLVVDPENMYYINDSHPDANSFVNPVRKSLRSAGAPFTTASFKDLVLMDLARYKLVIFCHPFDLDNGKFEKIETLCSGKTVLWIYAPGVIHNGKWDMAHLEEIAGAKFGEPGIHSAAKSSFLSFYAPEPGKLTETDMRGIMKKAGVHFWSEQSVPVHANERLAAVHIGKADEVTLVFPRKCLRITELFSGEVHENTDRIKIVTCGPETLLFHYEA